MFYIARNTLSVTPNLSKKKCYELWENTTRSEQLQPGTYTLCKDIDGFKYEVIQTLGVVQ